MAKQIFRPVDKVLYQFSEAHQNSLNQQIQWLCIPVLTFGLLGVIWSLPFPHLNFIGKYNGFVNWASFVIAFSVYYYYRLSPVLSYVTLLLIFAFSATIVSLEKLHLHQAWPALPHVSLGFFFVGLLIQYLGFKAEGKSPSLKHSFKFILIGPLWLSAIIFKKLRFKF